MSQFKRYPAKLMLFGEYTVINGSKALAIPYPAYGLQLCFEDGKAQSNEILRQYLAYLKDLEIADKLGLEQFEMDLNNDLQFRADIPIGYGLGSSGALVAAVYEHYCKAPISLDNLPELQAELGVLESFFHGKSSGFDPLVCYTNQNILVESKEAVKAVDLPGSEQAYQLFLLDTGKERRTGPYVRIFMEKLEQPAYEQKIEELLTPTVNEAIEAFVAGKPNVPALIGEISNLQFELMPEMIPDFILPYWQRGLDTGEYFLKLNGAGGGGFMLGVTKDADGICEVFGDYKVQVLSQE